GADADRSRYSYEQSWNGARTLDGAREESCDPAPRTARGTPADVRRFLHAAAARDGRRRCTGTRGFSNGVRAGIHAGCADRSDLHEVQKSETTNFCKTRQGDVRLAARGKKCEETEKFMKEPAEQDGEEIRELIF